jgi:hypothetical protein
MTTLEIILWIAAGIIISEIIFIWWTKRIKEGIFIDEVDGFGFRKFFSLLFAACFMFIQFAIVYGNKEAIYFNQLSMSLPRYENLLYELLIIGGIVLLVYINKKISDKILNEK